jgi:hypothetical protein
MMISRRSMAATGAGGNAMHTCMQFVKKDLLVLQQQKKNNNKKKKQQQQQHPPNDENPRLVTSCSTCA